MAEVEVRTLKEVDLKGGTVVAAFPSIGLVSTITATYMITNLKTDQVVALESPDFPSLSMIYAKKPKFPARVYASQDPKIAIFICRSRVCPRNPKRRSRRNLPFGASAAQTARGPNSRSAGSRNSRRASLPV